MVTFTVLRFEQLALQRLNSLRYSLSKKAILRKMLRSGILKKFINLLQIFVKTGVVFSRANGL